MSKRSRDVSFTPESEESPSPHCEVEGLGGTLENHEPPAKYCQTDSDASTNFSGQVLQCALAPHREILRFDSQDDYDVHYAEEHTNRCATCSKNFPTSRYLNLHIEENHNPIREALAARGEKTYGCFVEGCDRKCSTPQKRRLHMIDKHMFPKNYDFRIVDQGIDKPFSILRDGRRRRVSTALDIREVRRQRQQVPSRPSKRSAHSGETKIKMSLNNAANDGAEAKVEPHVLDPDVLEGWAKREQMRVAPASGVESLVQSLSALRFVPTSVLQKQKQKPKSSG